jgi:predicted metal-dependent phosphoesterase TrpH
MRRFGRADLCVFTSRGSGADEPRSILERVELRGELDVIAIADRDDVRGALEASEVHARSRYHFDLVTGVTVTTLHGPLLALWVTEAPQSYRPIEYTIAAVHAAGGVAVVPHPWSLITRSVSRRTIDRLLAIEDARTHPDAIEVASPMQRGRRASGRVRQRNAEYWRLAETASSAAQFLESISAAYTRFPGSTAGDLRRAILARETEGIDARGIPYRQIGARRLALQQLRSLGDTPRMVAGPAATSLRERIGARFAPRHEHSR